ncbi:MAG TPA: DUF4440 domain-containing protein [Anaeromyxobacter sp.]|nr:DUF4440 domain-containing protein [Anaeromyxobacter sp.]
MDAGKEIETWFECFNERWLAGRSSEVFPLLSPEVVLAPPGNLPRLRGAVPFIKSLDAFMAVATVHAFETEAVEVELLGGGLAAAWLRYRVDFTESGRRSRERASELWVFERSNGAWRALLREVHAAAPAG